jgi:arylsulfatase
MVVSWLAKIKHNNAPCSQFHHVTDVVPTIYEAINNHAAARGQWYRSIVIDGVGMAYRLLTRP